MGNMSKNRMNEETRENYDEASRNFHDNVLALKTFYGYKTKDLAEISGLSPVYIYQLFPKKYIGKKTPSLEAIVRLAFALNTTPGKLLDEKPPYSIEEYVKEKLLESNGNSPQ